VEAVYKERRPEKVGDIEQLMQEWCGSEDQLLVNVRRKYCQPEPEPVVSAASDSDEVVSELSDLWWEICAADDISTVVLLWCGEEAQMLPEESERLKYPALSTLAVVEHLLSHCFGRCGGGGAFLGDAGPRLAPKLQEAEDAIGHTRGVAVEGR